MATTIFENIWWVDKIIDEEMLNRAGVYSYGNYYNERQINVWSGHTLKHGRIVRTL